MTSSEKTGSAAHGSASGRPRVVIVGSGFGGLFAARELADAPVDVTLIGKTGHHLFQPLLYQVATGILSEGEIAPASREILKRQENARVVLGEVTDIDLANRTVTSTILGRTTVHPYDELIVAAGAGQSYFGNDRFAEFAPGMKSVDDALEQEQLEAYVATKIRAGLPLAGNYPPGEDTRAQYQRLREQAGPDGPAPVWTPELGS